MKDFQNFHQILSSQHQNDFLRLELNNTKIQQLIAKACFSKGLRLDIINGTHITYLPKGITINTYSASMANRLKQIQPTLEKYLFEAGINAPIVAIRSGKITLLPQQESYPTDAPRIAPSYAAEQVKAIAQQAKDEDVRKCLERLAQALKH